MPEPQVLAPGRPAAYAPGPAASLLRPIHLFAGIASIALFLGTGLYMDRVHDHLRGMPDAQRMLFRSVHIYILLSGLVNLVLGLYQRPFAGVARWMQRVGSLLLLAAPPILLLAFATEPWLTGLARPYTRVAVEAMLAGGLLQLLAAGWEYLDQRRHSVR